jgi:hypothetical protein
MSETNSALLPEHASHPGWTADGCPLRITVTPRNGGVTSHGFACEWTGGHCLPNASCDQFRRSALSNPESE